MVRKERLDEGFGEGYCSTSLLRFLSRRKPKQTSWLERVLWMVLGVMMRAGVTVH